jgi:hypothetical protein
VRKIPVNSEMSTVGDCQISKVICLPVRSLIYGNASLDMITLIMAANETSINASLKNCLIN